MKEKPDVLQGTLALMVLDALYEERREERYRTAPALRALGLSGRLGRQTGAGFFEYGADPA